ncbi:MAG: uracil-DNA glycosylase [Armatimonadota bacterium]
MSLTDHSHLPYSYYRHGRFHAQIELYFPKTELKRLGISRNNLWITNAVKCRPVKESAGILVNRAPTVKEIKNWLGPLIEELEIIHPRIIVCLGAVAAKALINKNFALTKDRGFWFDGPFGSRIIATFHPAYILRQIGDNWDIAMEEFRADLKQALLPSPD